MCYRGRGLVTHNSPVNDMNSPMHLSGKAEIMRDRDDSFAAERYKIAKDIEDLRGRERIQAAGRFIGENDRRIVGQRAGDSDALSLPARQLIGRFAKMIA